MLEIGIGNYIFENAKFELIENSKENLHEEFLNEGPIHENYNSLMRDGDDKRIVDYFYIRGDLFGLILLLEDDYLSETLSLYFRRIFQSLF